MAELFAAVRAKPADAATLGWFRHEKDRLFREHPQSPMPVAQRAAFSGLSYWAFDARMRVSARFIGRQVDGARAAQDVAFSRIGDLQFELDGSPCMLPALWIEGYAGGLFVPFRDATCGHETYGGGRYLLDTIKSGDLGSDYATGRVVLDFNYAYHPSCAYDPRWVCPLAPPESRLTMAIQAGERLAR
ncbi:MAG: DUF1684 domain-containing protein [Chloroflexota bacterium]|nr:DUF1684 domain-containing protein [Chloroflexota bacterium]